MEVLTRKSVDIKKANKRNKITATVGKDSFFISSMAMTHFKLAFGMKLIFVVDSGRLYFYIANQNESEGFVLRIGSKANVAMGKVSGTMLCKVLREKFPTLKIKNNACHPLRLSTTQINCCVTFEVLVDKKSVIVL